MCAYLWRLSRALEEIGFFFSTNAWHLLRWVNPDSIEHLSPPFPRSQQCSKLQEWRQIERAEERCWKAGLMGTLRQSCEIWANSLCWVICAFTLHFLRPHSRFLTMSSSKEANHSLCSVSFTILLLKGNRKPLLCDLVKSHMCASNGMSSIIQVTLPWSLKVQCLLTDNRLSASFSSPGLSRKLYITISQKMLSSVVQRLVQSFFHKVMSF